MEKLLKSLLLASLLISSYSLVSQGQVIDFFEYSGSPNDIRSRSVSTSPGSQLRFIFCTINVPDRLDVNLCGQGFSIYLGEKDIDINATEGYREYKFDGTGFQLIYTSPLTPVYIEQESSFCTNPKGVCVIDVTVPQRCCDALWTVTGNFSLPTLYMLKVRQLTWTDRPKVDTVYSYSCEGYKKLVKVQGCKRTVYIYADSSIQEVPIVKHPNCLETGYIEFPNYPELNRYNLLTGTYEFTISNSVCEKIYEVELKDSSICNYYFPNVFKPESLNNSVFQLFFDKPLEYDLFIYDRWGELVYRQRLNSGNKEGWDGTYKNNLCLPGVYIWRAVVYSDPYFYPSGDVTIIR